MPELPEVETVVRDLRASGVVGRVIESVRVYWPAITAPLSPAFFARRVRGRRILEIGRRAKFIVIRLSGGYSLLVHLRMTGQMGLARPPEPRDKHQHLILRLDDGRELRYRDIRKFGCWILTDAPDAITGRLGPEPLAPGFRSGDFIARLSRHRRRLKPLLLDQTFIAGLGNIYADETLWQARLHPLRRSETLSAPEARRLFKAIRATLKRGIRNRGTTLGNAKANFQSLEGRRGANQEQLKVFHRTGQPCPRCNTPIRRLIVAQRSSHVCPRCQRQS